MRRSLHAWKGFGTRPPRLARGGCSVPSAFGAAETRRAFLLGRAVGVTAAAWQSRERGRRVAAVTARFSPEFLYHLPSGTAHDLFTQPQQQPVGQGRGWGEQLSCTAHYPSLPFSHKRPSSSPKALARTVLTLSKLKYLRAPPQTGPATPGFSPAVTVGNALARSVAGDPSVCPGFPVLQSGPIS